MPSVRFLSVLLAAAWLLSACGGGAKGETAAQPPVDPDALERRGFVESEDGRLRISGKTPLVVSIHVVTDGPRLPEGWQGLAPVYDITARDRLQRAVKELPERLSIAFEAPPGVAATVLVHDGSEWRIVPSETAGSKVTALVDHLTPYTIAAPPAANGRSAGPTPIRTATPAPPAPAAATNAAPRGRSSSTPTVVATAATISPAEAQADLEAAVERLKGKKVRVEHATGYTGTLSMPLPPAAQQALGAALNAGGTAVYGLYNGINQAITVTASGGSAAGALTLLSEPKTQMPASESAAKQQIAQYFPGVPAALATVMAGPAAYVFTAQSGGTSYAAGIISLNGTVVAYAISGSGSYAGMVK